jgi:allantoinase
MAYETAKFAGLDSIKGQIAVGHHADFLIFDDSASFTISNDMIKHRHKITPYVGRKVQGQIRQTFVRGQQVYCDDNFMNNPIGQPLLKGKF